MTNVEFRCSLCDKLVIAPIKKKVDDQLTYIKVVCECPICTNKIIVRINKIEFLKN